MTDAPDRLATALADRYRLERELGAGGMATVYLAHDLRHERDVAIKVLHPDLGAALGGERFLAEIRTTAKLQHPHILPLLDSGDAGNGLLYYVMPFVRGETLRARLDRERQLPVDDAVRIAREVADALQHAHAQGIIHRDIKPENILLQEGHALVADFGIALAVQQAGGARMTQTGLSLGTPQHMAPEHAMGDKAVDHRADIYALGAVTYEMFTGEPPHMGTSAQAIVAKLLTEPVRPVAVLRPAVPAHVDAAVQVALQELPADRFLSVTEFGAALQGTTSHPLATARSATGFGPRSTAAATRRRWFVAALTLAACSAGAGWWLGRTSASVGGASSGSAGNPAAARLIPLATDGTLTGLAMSPDAAQYTVRAVDSAGSVMQLRSLTGAPTRSLYAGTPGESQFAPSGRYIASVNVATQSLFLVEVETGIVRTLASGVQARSLTWLGDSAVLVVPRGTGPIRRFALPSGTDTVLGPTIQDSVDVRFIGAADNGQLLATARLGGRSMLVALDANARLLDTLATLPGVGRVQLAADVAVVLVQGRLWGVPLDRTRRRATGPAREIVGAPAGKEVTYFASAETGALLVVRSAAMSDRDLLLVERAGRAVPATPLRRPFRAPRFAPSGRVLATLFTTSIAGEAATVDPTRGTVQRVTADSVVFASQWTADGRRLLLALGAIANERGLGGRVVSVAADGGGSPQEALRRPNPIYELERSPDGRTLVWREDAPETGRDIRMATFDRPDESVPLRASRWDERGIALSRDGRWLACTSNEAGRDEVYMSRLEADGPRWAVTRGGGGEPRWGAGGELLYRKTDTVFAVQVSGTDTPAISAPRQVLVFPSISAPFEAMWDVSPDGQRFAMVVQRGEDRRELLLLLDWQGRWRAEGATP